MVVFKFYIILILASAGVRALNTTDFVLVSASGTLNNEENGGGYLVGHQYKWKMPSEKYQGRVLFVQIVEMSLRVPSKLKPSVLKCAADVLLGDLNLNCNLPKANCRLYGYNPAVHDFKAILDTIDNGNCSAWFMEDKYPNQIKLRVFGDSDHSTPYIRLGLRVVVEYKYIEATEDNAENSFTAENTQVSNITPELQTQNQETFILERDACPSNDNSVLVSLQIATVVVVVIMLILLYYLLRKHQENMLLTLQGNTIIGRGEHPMTSQVTTSCERNNIPSTSQYATKEYEEIPNQRKVRLLPEDEQGYLQSI